MDVNNFNFWLQHELIGSVSTLLVIGRSGRFGNFAGRIGSGQITENRPVDISAWPS